MAEKKQRYFLIDTENVGDRWQEMLEKQKKRDNMIVFYTHNHSRSLEEFIVQHVHDPRFTWLECAAGNNALDYQLIGVLSYLITKQAGSEYHIVSNDKDYEATIEFWKDRGIDIWQDGVDTARPKAEKQAEKMAKPGKSRKKKKIKKTEVQTQNAVERTAAESMEEKPTAAAQAAAEQIEPKAIEEELKEAVQTARKVIESESNAAVQAAPETVKAPEVKPAAESAAPESEADSAASPEQPSKEQPSGESTLLVNPDDAEAVMHFIGELAETIPVANMQAWYHALVLGLGKEAGGLCYRRIKKDKAMAASLGEKLTGSLEERANRLIVLLTDSEKLEVDEAQFIYESIQKHSKEQIRAVRPNLLRQFGKERGENCYRALRPVLRMLKELA